MIKILIPTAKEMKVCQNIARPKLSAQTQIIIDYFSTLTVSDLEDIYRINTSAELVVRLKDGKILNVNNLL